MLEAGGKPSIRAMARGTGLAKSSVDRHCRAIKRRDQGPESTLWEQEVGYHYRRVLVFAVVFVLGIKGGVGAERLSAFFQRARLSAYVGSSPTALRRLRQELEAGIAAYQAEQEARLKEAGCQVAICVGADETVFDHVVLVMRDVVSGYLVLEEAADDRT